jgi:hypothetical protein
MELQDSPRDNAADAGAASGNLPARKQSMALARRRLRRLKLASVTASVLAFGGLTAGIAIQGIGSHATATASTSTASGTTATAVSTSVTNAATAAPTAAATATPSSTTSKAPIVSAQS